MNQYLQIIATSLTMAAITGCGQSRPDGDRGQADGSARQLGEANVDVGLSPIDKRVVALVSWLKHKGVTLELTGGAEGDTGWKVTQPKISEEYDVVFSIRSFPASASEEQMREALDVNLAYMLNAPMHLAMSFGGLSGTHPEAKLPESDDELPKLNGLPVTKAVKKLFQEYNGG